MTIATTVDSVAAKLDTWGKPAWIGVTVLGFMAWWPIGLAMLGFVIGSGRMGCWKRGGFHRWREGAERMRESAFGEPRSSGNAAFDEYRTDTLRRLEEEEREFRDFLERLRAAKDKAEFDQFMADRRGRPAPSAPPPG